MEIEISSIKTTGFVCGCKHVWGSNPLSLIFGAL